MGELRVDDNNLDEELNIFVTGFGVFRGFESENPSFKIAQLLPPSLQGSANSDLRANITVYPAPLRVSYRAVDKLTADLYSDAIACPYDIIVHIGVAGSIQGYQVEQRARRDKFPLRDVDGQFPSQTTLAAMASLPPELETSADLEDVYERWKFEVPSAQLAVSTDAGRYLCEYVYYSSLAWTNQWRKDVTTVFVHVPSNLDPESIEHGRDVVVGLLRAIIDSNAAKQRADHIESNQAQAQSTEHP